MRNHRSGRRLTALVLLLALCLTVTLPARAAEVRDTNFFTPREHADLDYGDMEFVMTDLEAVLAEMDETRTLAADAGNREAVAAGFRKACRMFSEAVTMSTLAYIRSCQDVSDEKAVADYESMDDVIMELEDALNVLARDILRSPCADALDGILTRQEQISMRYYQERDEELTELYRREAALKSEYRLEPGRVGEIYLDMIEVRREIAAAAGFDNYLDYAYARSFGRDYSPSQLSGFRRAVRETLVPILVAKLSAYTAVKDVPVMSGSYGTEEVLDLIEPCVGVLSDELLESFQYLRSHHLMDADGGEGKQKGGFTADLPAYGTAYIFSNHPEGAYSDLVTAVHEFGHFNENYWAEVKWDLSGKSMDLSEVHSQGMEMLFTRFYPALFGDDAAKLTDYALLEWVDVVVESVMIDEFERYAYTTEDLTVQDLNRKLGELYKEYGILPENIPTLEMTAWMRITHLFEFPGYYISYAVSAAGAFDFWLSARDDYFGAVDQYLRFTALDNSYGFADSFEAVGMSSPLTSAYVRRLAAALEDAFGAEPGEVPTVPEQERKPEEPEPGPAEGPQSVFRDVPAGSWFEDAVRGVCERGLMTGTGEGTFSPNMNLTRAQLVTILWRMEGEPAADGTVGFKDVPADAWYTAAVRWAASEGIVSGYSESAFGPGDDLTREQLMTILYRYAGTKAPELAGDPAVLSDVRDRAELSDWAREAAAWMLTNGVVTGTGDGALAPRSAASRAEAAVILLRFAGILEEEQAA